VDGNGTIEPTEIIASDVTDVDGSYYFGNLPSGNYQVSVPTPAANAPVSSAGAAGDNQTDLDDNGTQAGAGNPTYSPVIVLAAGTEATEAGANPGSAQDNAADTNGDMTMDFGFVPNQSIGSTVFYDVDQDGSQDPNEGGISGVTVMLLADTDGDGDLDDMVATTTTDANGNYVFTPLAPGGYIIKVTPVTQAPGVSPIADTNDNDEDGDNNGTQVGGPNTPVVSPEITLTPGGETSNEPGTGGTLDDGTDPQGNMTVDFGLVPNMSIGSTVFFDMNNDGTQNLANPQEIGIAGVGVQLLYDINNDGNIQTTEVVASDVTDASGNYYFPNLVPGNYQVQIVTVPASAPMSSTLNAGDNQTDGDDNGSQPAGIGTPVISPVINLAAGAEPTEGNTFPGNAQDNGAETNGDMTVDFGFVPALSIGSTVFYDADNSGTQESTNPLENGIVGITVQLWQDTDNNGVGDYLVETTTTNANGNYLFDMLSPGNYVVAIPSSPTDAPTSATGQDTDSDVDGNDNGAVGPLGVQSTIIVLTPNGETANEPGSGGTQDDAADTNGNMTVDFGFVPNMSIGSTVFYDPNNNGTQDIANPLEDGIAGVTVNLLYDVDGNGTIEPTEIIASDVTDVDGNYYFGNLPSGNYQVSVPTPAANAPVSSAGAAGDNQTDLDENGIQAGAGNPTYSPVIVLAAGTESTEAGANPGSAQDNAADTNGDMTMDFGFVPNQSIGSTVFYDVDQDGSQDPNEGGISGVTVMLLADTDGDGDLDDMVATTTTDANGNYVFTTLAPGDYIIKVTPVTQAPGVSPIADTNDNDEDGDNNGTQVGGPNSPVVSPVITLTPSGETSNEPGTGGTLDDGTDPQGNMTVDIGLVPNMSIGSLVFLDNNANGVFDAGDSGLAGNEVNLLTDLNGDGVIDPSEVLTTTVTSINGTYFFGHLLPGQYQVSVPNPPSSTPYSSPVAVTDTNDNQQDNDDNGVQIDGAGTLVLSPIITLSPGVEPGVEPGIGGANDDIAETNGDMTVDFGFYQVASLGNYVWNDLNANGMQDSGEPGIPGVTVTLTGTDGAGNPVNYVTTTDGNGYYIFEELIPGTYMVTFTQPTGFDFASPSNTTGDQLDSDPVGGVITGIVLTSGENDLTSDAGFYECPEITVTGLPVQPICPDEEVDAIFISTVPGAATISWSGGAAIGLANGGPVAGPNATIPAFIATAEGTVTITVTAVLGQCTITKTFTLTVDDSTAPFFENCPATPLVFGTDPNQCSALVNWPVPVAEDNCELNVVVTQTAGPASGTVVAATCPPAPMTITYVANDGNGNTASCNFTILVRDTEKPEFDADIVMPNDTVVNCHQVPTNCVFHGPDYVCTLLTNNDVHDNCTSPANLTLNFNEVSTQNPNPAVCGHYDYDLTRTWTVTDCSGNALVHTQLIQVQDTTKPVALCKPVTVTLDKFGKASITPADVNNGSYDNCAAPQYLTYNVTPNQFTCANLGANTVTLTVTDPCGNFSTCTAIVTVNKGIAPCTPIYTVETACLDNATTLTDGQFEEVITIKSLAMQTWTVTANAGLFTAASAAPPAAPTSVAVGTAFTAGTADGIDNDGDGTTDEADEMIYYTMKGKFTECIGYGITVSNAGNFGMAPAANTAILSNKACYPTPYFTNLDVPFCLYTPPFTIGVAETNGGVGTVINMTVDGVAATIFDAAALGLGVHTVTATFDAGTATNTFTVNGVLQTGSGTMAQALADPGCKQTITKIVEVKATPTAVVCNDLVHISLDVTCADTLNADDVLEGTYFCYDDYVVEIDRTLPYGNGPWMPGIVNAADIGHTYAYHLVHAGSGNSCWGTLTVEDKLKPTLTCPANVTIACSESTATAHTGTVGVTDCSPTTTQVDDVYTDFGQCASPRAQIVRTFVVTDASGNQSICSQTITITAFDLADVVFPADVTINCENAYLNANATAPAATGRPSINGFPIGSGGLCSASISFTDEIYDICEGSFEVLRTWKVRNACLGVSPNNPIVHVQLIQVLDLGGPQFACPGNVTVSVDATGCCATAPLPSMIVTEGCSGISHLEAKVSGIDPATGNFITATVAGHLADFPGNNYWNADTLAVFSYTQCLPNGGVYTVEYSADDECGNHSSCSFTMTIADLVPPVTACDEWTQVGLGFDGTAFVNASDLDDGSYDNCAPVHFKARRMDANACQTDTVFHDQVKFCCSDINDTINVILRVYDVNPGTGVVAINAFEGHYNECMVQVLVEDKIKPICTAPANVTVTCELFDPSLWAYGTAVGADNCCVDTIIGTVNYSQFDSLCNRGTITRNWTVKDCAANTANCSQKVIVQYNQEYYVKFPADKVISVCDGTGSYGAPTFFGEDCELLATSFVDEVFTVVPDACFKIERTWTVINWCTYTPNAACVYVPNPDALTGPTVSEAGNNIAGWSASSLAVNGTTFNYGNATNPGAAFAGFGGWTKEANCYQYKQIIKIIDTQDPVVVTPSGSEYCDYSTNDANYWNADYWWDNAIQSHNLCEGEADITITGIDSCSGANISFRYLLFLDMDGNGSMETVVPGSPLPQVYNEVRFDNVNTPGYAGGTPQAFDFRAVTPVQKWGWGLTTDTIGGARIAHVRWVNQQGQNAVPQLPLGTHKIKWTIEDGCGNEVSSETTITVKDCKKPTVVCVNGLAINQMNGPANTVTLWASDFLAYGDDNCTPSPLIAYGIRKSGTGSGFPTTTSVTFDCSELGTQLVELWGIDKAGNADFCETYVLVQDNTGACSNPGMATIAGALATEEVEGVEDANVELDGSSNGTPMLSEVFSNVSGSYVFSNALPITGNATITPQLDIDPLNGVNTWDLVLISRHILGLEPLNTPYKLIAADANKSGTVTTFDIVELRKLILGTYTALPNNESWRFIDKTQVFTNNENPFVDVIRENLQIANIQSSISDGDFVGAKIGDVDGTAVPNNLVSSDDRTAGQLLFDVTDRKVKAGETFTVNFKAAEKVAGYQFTMNFNGLEVVDVTPGTGMTMDNFGIFADAVTTSADATEGEFGVTFRAKQAGNLSQMLGVSSRITKAVAFTSATLGNQLDVVFRFNNGSTSTIAGLGFEVYQNAPNPWINKTVIGFHLPEATTATLTVTDATGRLIYTQKGNFGKGYNSFSLDRSLGGFTSSAAEMYYKVETATDSGVKQMIQVR
jgi:protocatechuate 3,4-dioxygenase beta subunit